jgi:hypothetical protein
MTMTLRAVTIVLSLAVGGCIAIPLPAPSVVKLEESPSADLDPLDPGETAAVLAADEEESVYVAGCVQEQLAKAFPNNRVVPAAEARDVLFPWLEPGAMPKDDAEAQALMARPAVAAKIRELKLRYLIEVGLVSTRAGIDTFRAFDAPMGVVAETESAHVSARVVDLEAACCRVGGSATATGVAAGAVYVVGIMFLPVIEGPACNRLSEALVQQLAPRMPSAP